MGVSFFSAVFLACCAFWTDEEVRVIAEVCRVFIVGLTEWDVLLWW